MEAVIRKEYLLEGLCCPMCAEKMQKRIRKINGVGSVAIDFPTQRLFLEVEDHANVEEVLAQAGRITQQYEIEIVILEAVEKARTATKPEIDWKARLYYARMGMGALLFIAGIAFDFGHPLELAVFLASYLLVGGEVIWSAVKNISRGQIFDENFLMSIATIGAFAIGEYPEGVAVMLFYQVGEGFQRAAVGRSRKSIAALMDIRPDCANLKTGNTVKQVAPEEVKPGEYILIRPGERVPLDGIVTEGRSALDTSALTGEALPRDIGPGSEILSGSINQNGLLTVEVTKPFGESTVSKILELVQNAGSKKSKVENFITKFARYYTPAVVASAALLAIVPPLLVPGALFSEWLGRALVFLVVSCPCALVISIPLSFFGGIGGASRNGVLVKGSNYLEALSNIDTVVFDKTGTLTTGTLKVTHIAPAQGFDSAELLKLAAYAESASTHPIAKSIRDAYGVELDEIVQTEELAGYGVRANIGGKTVLAGNSRLLKEVPHPAAGEPGTAVHLAVDGNYAGYLVVADEIKPDSQRAVEALKAAGVRQTVMLTGDTKTVGEQIAAKLKLDRVYAELLPHQKVEKLEELEQGKTTRGRIVFVGDGINDAPVLARADVGIAMGGIGSDAAIEAADVVLMTDEPSKVAVAIQVARKTRRIVWQNVVFALGVKAVILVLGALGIANMWMAVFGDVGVAVIAILNAMRAMQIQTEYGYVTQSAAPAQ